MTRLELWLSLMGLSLGRRLIDWAIGLHYRAYRRRGGQLEFEDWVRQWK